MTCPCDDIKRKMPRCDAGTPPVLEVHSKECPVLFHTVTIPASIGDLESMPPQPGAYRNARVIYEADNATYLYDSDGIPQLLVPDTESIIAEAVSQIPAATTSSNGLMSGADKAKLDSITVGTPCPGTEVLTNYGTITSTTTITPTENCFVTGKAVVLSNGGAAEISTVGNVFLGGIPYFATSATDPNFQQCFCLFCKANQAYTFRIAGTSRFEQVRTLAIVYA